MREAGHEPGRMGSTACGRNCLIYALLRAVMQAVPVAGRTGGRLRPRFRSKGARLQVLQRQIQATPDSHRRSHASPHKDLAPTTGFWLRRHSAHGHYRTDHRSSLQL
jgi:hypothetical protein